MIYVCDKCYWQGDGIVAPRHDTQTPTLKLEDAHDVAAKR
jgi:hypothetical protein